MTDHLLSTETMDVVHHGAETGRFEGKQIIPAILNMAKNI
jgi:hypothetical protein